MRAQRIVDGGPRRQLAVTRRVQHQARGPKAVTLGQLAGSLVGVMCVVVSAAACGGDGSGDSARSDASSNGLVSSMLAAFPASLRPADGDLFINAGDLDAATRLVGVERPGSAGDEAALFEWLRAVSGGLPSAPTVAYVALPETIRRIEDFAAADDEFGWSIVNVRSFAELLHEPASVTVYDVNESSADLQGAIGEPVDGIWRLGGEDGASVCFALRNGFLAQSQDPLPISTWLRDEGESLADDETLSEVANALDKAGVYAAIVADDHTYGLGEPPGPALSAFDTLGAGMSVVDGEPVGTLVYHFPNAREATANAAVVRDIVAGTNPQRGVEYSQMLDVTDISTDGELLIITFRVKKANPSLLWEMVQSRDLLTVHA